MVSTSVKPTFMMSRPDHLVSNMFSILGFERVHDTGEADVVVFPGGADINPFLYGAKRHSTTQVDYASDMQDLKVLKEVGDYQSKVGICRGGQFLNCVVGNGKLYQHVTNHAIHGTHPIYVRDKGLKGFSEEVDVTSTHHQMMIPGRGAELLYCGNIAMSKETDNCKTMYSTDTRKDAFDDAEVIYYPDRQTLCYQPHPEYLSPGNYYNRELFVGLVSEFLLDGDQSEKVWEKFYTNYQRP